MTKIKLEITRESAVNFILREVYEVELEDDADEDAEDSVVDAIRQILFDR